MVFPEFLDTEDYNNIKYFVEDLEKVYHDLEGMLWFTSQTIGFLYFAKSF